MDSSQKLINKKYLENHHFKFECDPTVHKILRSQAFRVAIFFRCPPSAIMFLKDSKNIEKSSTNLKALKKTKLILFPIRIHVLLCKENCVHYYVKLNSLELQCFTELANTMKYGRWGPL